MIIIKPAQYGYGAFLAERVRPGEFIAEYIAATVLNTADYTDILR